MQLNSLSPRVHWSLPDEATDRPILGAIFGERSAFIVEAGASPAHIREFLAAVARLNGPQPRFAALSHWHWDHVFGLSALGLPTFAHRETRERMAAMARLDWRDAAIEKRVAAGEESPFIADHLRVEIPNEERGRLVIALPEIVFDEGLEVDLGGLACQVIHVAGDHSPDSSVVFVPEERVVFLGDCLYSGTTGGEYFYTLPGLFPMLDRLTGLDADTYLLAHLPEPLTRAQMLAEAVTLKHIGEAVKACQGDRGAAIALLAAQGTPVDDAHLPDLDAFIRGLSIDPRTVKRF